MLKHGAALALFATAPIHAQIMLPPPGQQPPAIDFAHDSLLVFLAADSATDSFRTAVAEAVMRHPTVREAAADSDAAAAARREVRSGLFPGITASIVASRSLARDFAGNSAIVESLNPRGRTDAQIGADQLLFDFGATGGRIAGASARLRAARADAGQTATATTLGAVAAWYQVMGFQTLVDVSAALVERHRAILGDTRTRVAAGLGTGGDVARADAGLADAIAAGTRAAQSLARVRARYRELFGIEAPLRPVRPARPASVAPDAAVAASMSHATPAVIAALARTEAEGAEARAVRGDALPRLSAGISGIRYDAFRPGNNYDVRGQIVLRQAFALGGAETARTDRARARAHAAGFASDRSIAEAERDASAAFADAHILDASVAAREDAYRANRRSRDIMAEQFRLSRGSLIDLLRAEEQFFAAAEALLQASIERDLARYTLLGRTGELLPLFGLHPDRPEKG